MCAGAPRDPADAPDRRVAPGCGMMRCMKPVGGRHRHRGGRPGDQPRVPPGAQGRARAAGRARRRGGRGDRPLVGVRAHALRPRGGGCAGVAQVPLLRSTGQTLVGAGDPGFVRTGLPGGGAGGALGDALRANVVNHRAMGVPSRVVTPGGDRGAGAGHRARRHRRRRLRAGIGLRRPHRHHRRVPRGRAPARGTADHRLPRRTAASRTAAA